MQADRLSMLAGAIVLASGALWGLYWLPVRMLSERGLPGAVGTLAITLAAVLLLLPFAALRWRKIAAASPVSLLSIAIGGAAFALYSIGFVYGDVAIIILLYFLTPVWSTLIGRYCMGWPTPSLRIFAILAGLAGLGVMLGADGGWPVPRGAGEWMALIAGILWSVATTGIRARAELDPFAASFVFALGAALVALVLAVAMDGGLPVMPQVGLSGPLIIAVAAGALWWGASMVGLLWATARLEPARVGILLMSEVLVGAVTAAIFAGKYLSTMQLLGGSLVLLAAVLEIWPIRSVEDAPRQH